MSVSNKGRRHTRVVDNLTMARKVEGAIKGDLARVEYDIADHKAADRFFQAIGDALELRRIFIRRVDQYDAAALLRREQ